MFIIAQIPFVDFRILSKDTKEDCFFPNMFDRNIGKSTYYRFLGSEHVGKKTNNGIPNLDRQFFDSTKLLSLSKDKFIGKEYYEPTLLFSRFFTDKYSFHFDIGIREHYSFENKRNLDMFLREFILSPFFKINRFNNNNSLYTLIGLTKEIQQIYLYATKSKTTPTEINHIHQIKIGNPALFVVYDNSQTHYFDKLEEIKLNNGITIYHNLLTIKNTFVDVWYIGRNEALKKSAELRNLRIFLSKLHSYKESTRLILNYLDYHSYKNIDMHKVVAFLEKILEKIKKEKDHGFNNRDFWPMALKIDNVYNYANWKELIDSIEARIEEIKVNKATEFHQTINDSSFVNSPVVSYSKDVNINITNNNFSEFNDLIDEFNTIAAKIIESNDQITKEQSTIILGQIDTFRDYLNNDKVDKGFSNKLLENIKNAFQFVISNSTSLQQLMDVGAKIVSLIK